MCGSSTFPICVREHVSDSPLFKSNHKPMQRGERAAVCVKNRTWYYWGISKRPVKIKGFREVLRSSFGHCQHFFWHLLFHVVGENCFLFAEQHVTSSCHARMTWKRETHSKSQTWTFVLYIHLNIPDEHLGLTSKPQMLLMVYLNVGYTLNPLSRQLPFAFSS